MCFYTPPPPRNRLWGVVGDEGGWVGCAVTEKLPCHSLCHGCTVTAWVPVCEQLFRQMLVCTSNVATETTILGSPDKGMLDAATWVPWSLDDTARAELPAKTPGVDPHALGSALLYCSQRQIDLGTFWRKNETSKVDRFSLQKVYRALASFSRKILPK